MNALRKQPAEKYFGQAMHHLRELNKIQAGEGHNLHQASRNLLQGAHMLSFLEVILAIAFGIFALVLIRLPEKSALEDSRTRYSLN